MGCVACALCFDMVCRAFSEWTYFLELWAWAVWLVRFGLFWFSVRFLSACFFWNFSCGLCGFGALALTARLSLA